MKNLTVDIYYVLEQKYLSYCEQYEARMEEYYENYTQAHHSRVIEPATERINNIIERLGYSTKYFWLTYTMDLAY